MRVGGAGATQAATPEVQALCDGVRDAAQSMAQASGWNGIFSTFEAKEFKSQVVAGTNFFVKVQVSETQFAHVRIYRALSHTGAAPSVAAVKLVDANEPLDYFEAA